MEVGTVAIHTVLNNISKFPFSYDRFLDFQVFENSIPENFAKNRKIDTFSEWLGVR